MKLFEVIGHGTDVQDYNKKLDTAANYLASFVVHETKKTTKEVTLEDVKTVFSVIEKDLSALVIKKLQERGIK